MLSAENFTLGQCKAFKPQSFKQHTQASKGLHTLPAQYLKPYNYSENILYSYSVHSIHMDWPKSLLFAYGKKLVFLLGCSAVSFTDFNL